MSRVGAVAAVSCLASAVDGPQEAIRCPHPTVSPTGLSTFLILQTPLVGRLRLLCRSRRRCGDSGPLSRECRLASRHRLPMLAIVTSRVRGLLVRISLRGSRRGRRLLLRFYLRCILSVRSRPQFLHTLASRVNFPQAAHFLKYPSLALTRETGRVSVVSVCGAPVPRARAANLFSRETHVKNTDAAAAA